MKRFAKVALVALALASAATALPAEARVVVGVGIGSGYYGPPAPPYPACNPYSRFYNPAECTPDGYYGPAWGPDFGFFYGGGGRFHGGGFHGGGFHGGFHGGHR